MSQVSLIRVKRLRDVALVMMELESVGGFELVETKQAS